MERWNKKLVGLGAAVVAMGVIGCGNSADTGNNDNEASGPQQNQEASFALASTVLGENSQTTFVRYLDAIDRGNIELDEAREYPGYATIGSIGGMFFVASGKSPKITRFQVSNDGALTKDGTIGFSQHVDEAPLYANTFANPTTAYLDKGDTGHVIWNPKEMTIEKAETVDEIPKKVEELPAFRAFNRGTVVRDNLVFQPYHWRGKDFYEFASKSKIVVRNAETNEVETVIDAPCPGLDVGTKDSEGNIYFTNWVNATAAPVIEGEEETHDTCAVKIDAGSTSLSSGWPKDLAEMTDGREVAALRILEGSTALAAVLDHEKVDANKDTDPAEITRASNWELWRLDLEEGSGSKVDGIGYIAGGYYAFRLDGKMVALLPNSDYAKTTAYEIPVEGKAIERFNVKGWVYQMVDFAK